MWSIFSCTCWLCVSLLEKCLFFNCFLGFFSCWIVGILYISCILTPYRKWLASIFSRSVMSFAAQELFNLTQSHLFAFAFIAFVFDVKSKKKNDHQDWYQKTYHLHVLLRVLWFQVSYSNSLVHFELISLYDVR